MNLKNEVVTISNGDMYYVYDFLDVYNNDYYMMFKIVNDDITNEVMFATLKNGLLEIVEDDDLFDNLHKMFLQENINQIHHVPTPHIESNYNDIAPLVIMPGDPLRVKLIAEKYLKDAKLVSDVRNVYAYTGYYKGKRVTAMAAGMGMPSAGIYYHELFKFYDVEKIIRIGTCGAANKDERLLDLVIADKSYTTSNFAFTYTGKESYLAYPSKNLTDKLIESANLNHINFHQGGVFTMDFFGPYIDTKPMYDKIPKDFNIAAEEMECFGLLLIANTLGKEAACILTVVDSPFYDDVVSSEQREQGMDNMIMVALDAIIKK